VNESNITGWNNNSTISIKDEVPAKIQGNRRITWDSDKKQYALTTDPTNGGLYFKFGSVVGIYTAHGAVATFPTNTKYDTFEAAKDVAWDPTGAITGYVEDGWTAVPEYESPDYPRTITPEFGYHTAKNVKAGKGDPCRLVGIDLAKIKTTDANALTTTDIDNGKWRLPTPDENKLFTGRDKMGLYTQHWTAQNGVNGGMFPNKTSGDATTFLPAVGYRMNDGEIKDQGTTGNYWTSSPRNSTNGLCLSFYSDIIRPTYDNNFYYALSVRCVRQ
jgi:uncharacterized protein (TIGR02145 family)